MSTLGYIAAGLITLGILGLADPSRYDKARREDIAAAGLIPPYRPAGCIVIVMRPLFIVTLLAMGGAGLLAGYSGGPWYSITLAAVMANNVLSAALGHAEDRYMIEDKIPVTEHPGGRPFDLLWGALSMSIAAAAWYLGTLAAG